MTTTQETNSNSGRTLPTLVAVVAVLGLLGWGAVAYVQTLQKVATPTPSPTTATGFTGDAKNPASGTKTVDFTMTDDKLAAGPSEVDLTKGQYVLFHPTVAGSSDKKYEFYVESYGKFEVDVFDGTGSFSGEAYFQAANTGVYAWGIEDENSGAQTPLGKVVVQ